MRTFFPMKNLLSFRWTQLSVGHWIDSTMKRIPASNMISAANFGFTCTAVAVRRNLVISCALIDVNILLSCSCVSHNFYRNMTSLGLPKFILWCVVLNMIAAVADFFPPFLLPERIHQAQAAAAKARKALQQKPKPSSKPVSLLLSVLWGLHLFPVSPFNVLLVHQNLVTKWWKWTVCLIMCFKYILWSESCKQRWG